MLKVCINPLPFTNTSSLESIVKPVFLSVAMKLLDSALCVISDIWQAIWPPIDRTPVVAIRDAVFTVSPKMLKRGVSLQRATSG